MKKILLGLEDRQGRRLNRSATPGIAAQRVFLNLVRAQRNAPLSLADDTVL